MGEDPIKWNRQHRRPSTASTSPLLGFPSSLCALLVLYLLATAPKTGVGEPIGGKDPNCCGMRTNIGKCWTDLACACKDCSASETRRDEMSNLSSRHEHYRLEFCSSFPLDLAVSDDFLTNKTFCREQKGKLQEADKKANSSYENFKRILARIDCGTNGTGRTYSATSTCRDCLTAYEDWICFTEVSKALSFLDEDETGKAPCINLCQKVLQKCPYLPPTVPSDDWDNVVQIGYSAFNCLVELNNKHQDYKECLKSDPNMKKCEGNKANDTAIQPTARTVVTADNSTTNSTVDGNR